MREDENQDITCSLHALCKLRVNNFLETVSLYSMLSKSKAVEITALISFEFFYYRC